MFAALVAYCAVGIPDSDIPVERRVLDEDPFCSADACGVNLLQRKAAIKKPDSKDSHFASLVSHKLEGSVVLKDATTTTTTTTAYSCSQETMSPYTVEADGFVAIVNDPLYISMLQKVVTFGGIGLYDSTKCVTWPGLLLVGEALTYWTNHFESDFPNTALFTWGSNTSDSLYIYTPGTNALCTQYAAMLSGVASMGYFVVCPQLSGGPSAQESVMKPTIAAEWALSFSSFSSISIGGHSGGASTVPAAARLLINKGIPISRMVLQHPGVVGFMNIPGCAALASELGKTANEYYCDLYFPADLLDQTLSAKMLVVAGSFCQWTKAQNSNWLSNYACGGYGTACADGQTFPTPADRPEQPPVTCPADAGCPDVNFLANPGDCMFECDAATMETVYIEPLWDIPRSDVTMLQGCTDHGYGVVGPNGFKESGPPILPFLNTSAPDGSYQTFLQSWNQTEVTCKSWENVHEQCLFPVSPFTTEFTKYFADEAGTVYPCKDAKEMTATGLSVAFHKSPTA